MTDVGAAAEEHAGDAGAGAVRSVGRYQELDGLRGIAAAGVVVFHVLDLADTMKLGARPLDINFGIGAFGVQLFFLISGFVILLTVRRARSSLDFLLARVTRLYPAFWVCLTVTVVVSAAGPVQWMTYTPARILVNYTMIPEVFGFKNVDGSYWTLFVELVFYVLMAVAVSVGLIRNESRLATVATLWSVLCVLIAAAAYPYREVPAVRHLSTALILQYAPLFATGMLMLRVRERRAWDLRVSLAAACSVLSGWLVQDLGAAIATAVVVTLFLWVTSRPGVPLLRTRGFTFLGEVSYPWYLLHQNISYVIIAVMPHRWAASAVAIAGTLCLAWLVHRYVEVRASQALRRSLRGWLVRHGAIPAA